MYDTRDTDRESEFEWRTDKRATATDLDEAGSGPSRRTFLRGSVAVGAAATVGGFVSAAAACGTATLHALRTDNSNTRKAMSAPNCSSFQIKPTTCRTSLLPSATVSMQCSKPTADPPTPEAARESLPMR
jgi:hypothetical protein